MKKRIDKTPRSKIRSALRQLSLRSRERAFALKRDNYTCIDCKKRQSKAKGKEVAVCVHHVNGSGIEEIIDMIYDKLLCNPDDLVTLCAECHDKQHRMEMINE